MSDPSLLDRDLRQRDIVPPERLAQCRCTVVGVGAIGRQVCLQLAAMGAPWLQLVDHDVVEPVNLGCQGFLESDLNRPKVEATAELCGKINRALDVHPVIERFRRSMKVGNAVFCCVDKIDTRQLIWQAAQQRVDFYVDGRMAAEVLRVLVAADKASREHYPSTCLPRSRRTRGHALQRARSSVRTSRQA